jgi:hypothetical protein
VNICLVAQVSGQSVTVENEDVAFAGFVYTGLDTTVDPFRQARRRNFDLLPQVIILGITAHPEHDADFRPTAIREQGADEWYLLKNL